MTPPASTPKASRPAPATSGTIAIPAAIRHGEYYPAGEFRRITGLGVWAMRSLRKAGLPVLKICGRSFISGSAFIELLERQQSTD